MLTNHPDRLCICTPSARMKAVSHTWDRYNAVTRYSCDNCSKTVDLVPLSHIGYTFTVGALAISIVIFIFIIHSRDAGVLTYLIIASLMVFQIWSTVAQLSVHHRHRNANALQAGTRDPSAKGLRTRIERMSFWAGLFLPIGVIAAVLAAATVLGMAHHYVFPPP